MLHAKFTALCFMESELLWIEVLHCGNEDFHLFAPVTFIYELGRYFLEIYRMCKDELPMSRVSEVIV